MELKTREDTDVFNETLHFSRTKDSAFIVSTKKRKLFDSENISYNDSKKSDFQDNQSPVKDATNPSTNCIPTKDSSNFNETKEIINEILTITSNYHTSSASQDSEDTVSQPVPCQDPKDTVSQPVPCQDPEDTVSQPVLQWAISKDIESSNFASGKTSILDIQESSYGDSVADLSETSPAESLEDLASLDSRRARRNGQRKKNCCPVCGVTIREPELESHYAHEIEKLAKISKSVHKPHRDDNGISTSYVRVKSNRENRLTAKVAKYAAKAKQEVQCPVCKVRMSGSEDEINKHVVLCVQNEENNDEHVNVDDDEEDDESFEEYEIGNQTRIRPISLIPGGYRGLQVQTAKRSAEDEDLDVDVDDTMAYGQPQYTELDVIPNNFDGLNKEQEELRKAVLNDPTAQPKVLESRKWSESTDGESSRVMEQNETLIGTKEDVKDDQTTEEKKNLASDHIVSSLKEKIKDLEDQDNSVKCLICMESYTKPVVSTTCWHVHCEECWLMTMGVKKLCPQCNMIVFPSDLRKIYL